MAPIRRPGRGPFETVPAPPQAGLCRTIERHRAIHGVDAPPLLHVDEPGLLEQRDQLARHVVPGIAEAVEKLNRHEQPSHQRICRAPPVGNVQLPARFEHPVEFAGRALLVLPAQVVEEQARDHPIKAGGGIGQPVRQGLNASDRRTGVPGLTTRNRQNRRVAVYTNDIGLRLLLLDPDRQGAGTTRKIPHLMTGLQTSLTYQRLFEASLTGGRPDHRIVKRREPAEAQRQ